MVNPENIHLVEEELESSALSENSRIAQMFEVCLQPRTEEDLDNVLLDFRERIKGIKHSEYISILDYVSIYALDYVYIHDTVSFCSVSRTLYLYHLLDELISEGENRDVTDSEYEDLFNELRKFTNLYEDSESEAILVEASVNSILSGNLGITFYLDKFRLIKLPSEVNTICKDIFEVLVNMLNSSLNQADENVDVRDMENSVQLHEFLNKLKDKEVNITRSILTFCILTIVAEYKVYEKLEADLDDIKIYTDHKKHSCMQKFLCINAYIDATMELDLTFKEIETFTEVFLNPFITAEVGRSLVETCKKLLTYSDNYYNIRSLKDLARRKVRSMFRKSMSIPEQVNALEIPVTLKDFLNFHGEGIWNVLLVNHQNSCVGLELSHEADEIEDEDGQAIEDEDGQAIEDEDGQAIEDEDGQAIDDEDGQAIDDEDGQAIDDEDEQAIDDEDARQLEDGNAREFQGVNLSAKKEGNVSEL